MTRNEIKGTHTRIDPDVAISFWLKQEYEGLSLEKTSLLFLKGGDETLTPFHNMELIDRGRGEFDHHGRRLPEGETSASLIAKKLGVADDKYIQQLLGLNRRNDLQGISLPFDLTDIIKCAQRNDDLDDEERLKLGIRVISAAMEFRKKRLQRDNQYGQRIIANFLAAPEPEPTPEPEPEPTPEPEPAEKKGKVIPAKFIQYLERLNNLRFERPFDLVEIIIGEEARSGKEEATEFAETVLKIVYKDSLKFYETIKELQKALKIIIKGIEIVAKVEDSSKFNVVARARGASVIIQRNTDGRTQIYFNTEKVDDKLVDSIVSIVRLEECLIQGREIPRTDLRKPERVEEIPEWYYYKAPRIGKKMPGRFILNGSLTAPDVPPSKIPLETLFYIVQCAVRYYPSFNWVLWKSERVAHYQNKN